jgi:SAM-dependent methyltransferase
MEQKPKMEPHKHHVCPWWLGYLLTSPIRRLQHDPARIFAPYVSEGMTILEPGPGMGFFTLELARRVGASGLVIAVDTQPKMINRLKKRAAKAGLLGRIDARVTDPGSMMLSRLAGSVDFVFAFAMVHEIPDVQRFFAEVAQSMKATARMLLAEPAGHVGEEEFAAELKAAEEARLKVDARPAIRSSRSALLRKV